MWTEDAALGLKSCMKWFLHECEERLGNNLVLGEVGIESSNTWLLVAWDRKFSLLKHGLEMLLQRGGFCLIMACVLN